MPLIPPWTWILISSDALAVGYGSQLDWTVQSLGKPNPPCAAGKRGDRPTKTPNPKSKIQYVTYACK